ncbi:MAG: LysR family transcriptional regulator [Actinobacteria bacterium]|nr:LysR family transcriptional regulator [Actinomycetota bacterium]
MSEPLSRLAGVDLNLLVTLDALLLERSVTRAGRRLSLTQSATSNALARLRRLFDDELLVRTEHGMRPTPRAEGLELPLREILGRVEEAVLGDAGFDPAHDTRTFNVLATDYVTLTLVRPLIKALAVEAPNIHLRVGAEQLETLDRRLQRGEADLALLPSRLTASTDGPSVVVYEDRFLGVVAEDNAEVGERLTRRHLRELPYLSFRQGRARSMVDLALERMGLGREPDATCESFLGGAFLLPGTRMFAFLQERLIDELGKALALRAMKPPVDLPPLVTHMSWHPRSSHDVAHRWLRERILRLAATLPDG